MRIGIVHGRSAVRRALSRMISRIDGHEVIWTARDAEEAARAAKDDPPDLLLLETQPRGLDPATRRLSARSPRGAVALVSSIPGSLLPDAFRDGIRDLLPEPRSDGGSIRPAELSRLARVLRLAETPATPNAMRRPDAAPLVAIGASTGGPPAVARVLAALPAGFAPAVLVAQHLDTAFSEGLISWLATRSAGPVRRIRPGERPAGGTIHVAAADAHLFLTPDGVFSDLPADPENACIPSVDLLFRSLAAAPPGVAVLLTGMGRDGADGLLALRRAGWHTIAQDAGTSAVYGMPRAARDLDAAAEILALGAIAPAIVAATARIRRRRNDDSPRTENANRRDRRTHGP